MHNARVMGALQKMLQTGGRTIWVAPSGGRDRPSTAPDARPGEFAVAPFDPKSVEMFRLMASKAKASEKGGKGKRRKRRGQVVIYYFTTRWILLQCNSEPLYSHPGVIPRALLSTYG